MVFRKTLSPDPAAIFVSEQISDKLANDKKVLWLVPGGSASIVAVQASRLIKGVDSSLHLSLTDERPGPVGHANSNWQQLKNEGFNYLSRDYYEVLQNRATQEDTEAFDAWLGTILKIVDFKIGLFGIGSDGHTAGLLAGSQAVSGSGALAGYYQSSDTQRISITPLMIAKLDMAVVYAVGQDKHSVLEALKQGPSGLPMDALGTCPQLFIYNDLIGE